MQWRSYKIDVNYQIKFFHVPLARFSTNFCIRFFCSKSIQLKHKYQFNSNTNQINSPLPKMHQHHRQEWIWYKIPVSEFKVTSTQSSGPHELDQWNCHLLSAGWTFKKKRPTTTPGNDTLHRATGLPGHNYTILFSPSLSFFFSFIVAQLTQNSTSICICILETNRIRPATI